MHPCATHQQILLALNYEFNQDPHLLQDPTVSPLDHGSSLKTGLLLHLLLRGYSQPAAGVILLRGKSDHDTLFAKVSLKLKTKVIRMTFMVLHNLAPWDLPDLIYCSPLLSLSCPVHSGFLALVETDEHAPNSGVLHPLCPLPGTS